METIVTKTDLIVDFGGGLKTNEDLNIAFDSGADKITGGSIAVNDKTMFLDWLGKYGSDKIILGADCLDNKIATGAWLESTDIDVIEFIQSYKSEGISTVICTDISKDGMLEGPSNELYKDIISNVDIDLIASGGVACFDDLLRLKEIGCSGAILGKAIYEGRITLKELRELC